MINRLLLPGAYEWQKESRGVPIAALRVPAEVREGVVVDKVIGAVEVDTVRCVLPLLHCPSLCPKEPSAA